jgi:hypothetical protein
MRLIFMKDFKIRSVLSERADGFNIFIPCEKRYIEVFASFLYENTKSKIIIYWLGA